MSKPYSLVCFMDEILKNEQKSIDIVPSKWLHFNDEEDMVCPFLSKFSDSNVCHLHKLVKELKSPIDTWKLFRAEIKGYAETYEEALKKLEILKEESDVFSTEDDQLAKEVTKKKNRLKGQKGSTSKSYKSVLPSIDLTQPMDMEKTISKMVKNPKKGASMSNEMDELSLHDIVYNESNSEKTELSNLEEVRSETVTLSPVSTNSREKQVTLSTINEDIQDLKEYVTNSFKKLASQLSMLQSEVVGTKIGLERLIKRRDVAAPEHEQFKLPFTSLKEFQEFDQKITTDEATKEKVAEIIWTLLEINKPLNKTLTNIFAKFCSRQVIANYTAKNPVPGKFVMKDTALYACAFAKVNEELKKQNKPPVNEVSFYKSIGAVINCSRDWDGQREKRKKQTIDASAKDADTNE
ncbi:unnamed protein product [Brassicogethes aeneus]|uniref:DUF4806 domain-containing protein n=1 Tax=Brassicogethes aeneus TaxID=1431903 RepID=A0A9P0ASA4_BRAAE|nr:unnamed protein product [Brassicogethes aeneus]